MVDYRFNSKLKTELSTWRFYLNGENHHRVESNDAVDLIITVDGTMNGHMVICEYENRIGSTKINHTLDVNCKQSF